MKLHLKVRHGDPMGDVRKLCLCTWLIGLQTLFFMPQLHAQSTLTSSAITVSKSANATPVGTFTPEILWTEEFSGSTNSQGNVLSLDSTVGYVFSRNLGLDAGIPVYFVHGITTNSTGGTSSTSSDGIGDAYVQLRLSFPNPLLNYNTVLTGTVPTGSTADGFSTGHSTYDWTNHFDRGFRRWTPYAEIGIGNSIPSNFVFNREYASFGHEAHFQVGAQYQVVGFLSVSASAYDVAPWGTQTIFSRVVPQGNPPPSAGGHGPVFGQANQTTGGAGVAADNGFNAGVDISTGSLLDFSVGYSHSVHFGLDTFSFGIGVNMSRLLQRAHTGQ
jgi:hypothetical protein